MMITAAAGALLLAAPRLAVNLTGFMLLYLSFLLDKVDGEIARYRRVESPRAILLDRFHHLAIEPAMLFGAAYREYARTGAWGLLLAALVAILLGNIIEEQPHLAPYALIKHLREVRRFPRTRAAGSPQWTSAYRFFRGLKVFRMFITVLFSLAALYVAQWATGGSLVSGYLYATVVALTVYLAFQTTYYFGFKLESEIESLGHHFRPGVPGEAAEALARAAVASGGNQTAEALRPVNEGRTGGPRRVSGATRHETQSRVVRDLAS